MQRLSNIPTIVSRQQMSHLLNVLLGIIKTEDMNSVVSILLTSIHWIAAIYDILFLLSVIQSGRYEVLSIQFPACQGDHMTQDKVGTVVLRKDKRMGDYGAKVTI